MAVEWRMWRRGCSVEEVEAWLYCGGYGGVAVVWRMWRCDVEAWCGCSVEVVEVRL